MIILSRTCSGITLFNATEFKALEKDVKETNMKETILKKNDLHLDREMKPFERFVPSKPKTAHSKALTFINGLSAVRDVKQLNGVDFSNFDSLCRKLTYNVSFVRLNNESADKIETDSSESREFSEFKENCFDLIHSSAFIDFQLLPHFDESSLLTIVYSEKQPNFHCHCSKLENKHLIYIIPENQYFYKIITKNIKFLEIDDPSKPRILSVANIARFITMFSFIIAADQCSFFNKNENELRSRMTVDFCEQCDERQRILNDIIGDIPKDIFEQTMNYHKE